MDRSGSLFSCGIRPTRTIRVPFPAPYVYAAGISVSSKYDVALRVITMRVRPGRFEPPGNSIVPSRSVSRHPERSMAPGLGFARTIASSSRIA